MPRTSKTNLKRASSAARTETQNDPRQFDLARKPAIIERVAAVIYHFVMTTGVRAATISVADIISQVNIDAGLNEETLGPRTVQTIYLQLSRLCTNRYIGFIDSELEEFAITEEFKSLIQQLADMHKEHAQAVRRLDPVARHRVKCSFFRAKFRRRTFKKQATRRELDLENRRLRHEAEKHKLLCPLLIQRATSVTSEATELIEDTTENVASGSRTVSRENVSVKSDSDNIYVDDIEMAEASRPTLLLPCTPVRSGTLNNPGAYPSPESVPRQVSSVPSTTYLTPSRSRSPTSSRIKEVGHSVDEDEEMEVSSALYDPDDVEAPADSGGSINVLKKKIQKLEKAVQKQRKKEHNRMNVRRKSWKTSPDCHDLQRRRLWKALRKSRRKFERLQSEIEVQLHDMQERHNTEIREARHGHDLHIEELKLRHQAEIKVLQDRMEEVERDGKAYAENMQKFLQQGFQQAMALSTAFLSPRP